MKELDDIKARLAVLTWAPPWKAWDRGIGYEVHSQGDQPINSGHRETFTKADAEFIAAAPADLARLTAAVEAVLSIAGSMDRIADFNLGVLPHDDMGISLRQHAEDLRSAIEKALKP